ncbi:MAG: hypothetical protein AAB638_02085 [Patescibacteria group bacterium]
METTPNEQLEQLEREYKERRQAIESQTAPEAVLPSEHETMSQVVEGKIQEQVPDFKVENHSQEPTGEDNNLDPEARGKIQEWVNIAFTKGPYESIQALRDNDPALIDKFHSALTGELYKMLVQNKKLEEVK